MSWTGRVPQRPPSAAERRFLAAASAVRPALLARVATVDAAGLLQATSLPFLVTASQIGVLTGLMSPVTAAAPLEVSSRMPISPSS